MLPRYGWTDPFAFLGSRQNRQTTSSPARDCVSVAWKPRSAINPTTMQSAAAAWGCCCVSGLAAKFGFAKVTCTTEATRLAGVQRVSTAEERTFQPCCVHARDIHLEHRRGKFLSFLQQRDGVQSETTGFYRAWGKQPLSSKWPCGIYHSEPPCPGTALAQIHTLLIGSESHVHPSMGTATTRLPSPLLVSRPPALIRPPVRAPPPPPELRFLRSICSRWCLDSKEPPTCSPLLRLRLTTRNTYTVLTSTYTGTCFLCISTLV